MLDLPPTPPWMALAACAGMPTELWFPERGERPEVALKTCHTCVVSDECVAYGLGEHFGIWGGLSERQRRKVRRRHIAECDDVTMAVAPELLNGDAPPTLPQEVTEPAGMAPDPSSPPAHSCQGCGASLEGRQPSTRWCSSACRNRNRERNRENESPRTAPGYVRNQVLGVFDLAGLLAAAVPPGVSFTVELAGATVSACRE
jgi:WhiB family redox-sensing transcriptional regulator